MRIRFWRKPIADAVEKDAEEPVAAITNAEFQRLPKTMAVLVRPSLIASCMQKSASHPRNEVGGFILGRTNGAYLLAEDIVHLEHAGQRTRVKYSPQDLFQARKKAKDGQSVVGWFHSHPGYGIFLSGVDLRHQEQCQTLFPDFLGLVMDPLRPCGVDFAFLRTADGQEKRMPHQFLLEDDPE